MPTDTSATTATIRHHLDTLVRIAPARPPGSPANRVATDHVAAALRDAGLAPTLLPFEARYWRPGRAELVVGGRSVPLDPPPYCRSARVAGPAVRAASVEQLDRIAVGPGAVIVLTGDLAAGPIFPKAFPFVSFPEQVALVERLESLRPAAVLAVRPEEAVHEPVFEDPDLDFPYATIPASLGDGIATGAEVRLEVEATGEAGAGCNVSAGASAGRRAVVCAHVDSKVTTNGALDNAGGVAALLGLAHGGLQGMRPVELVFFNGEDHYAAPGEQAWLAERDLGEVELVVNVDGAGLGGYRAAVSAIGAAPELEARIEWLIAADERLERGAPWFESDHAVFAMRGIPAVAITSAAPFDLLKRRSHVPDAAADLDVGVLAAVAAFIRALLAA